MQTCSSTMVNNGAVSEVEPVELEGVEAAMSSNDGTLKSTLIPRPKFLGISFVSFKYLLSIFCHSTILPCLARLALPSLPSLPSLPGSTWF